MNSPTVSVTDKDLAQELFFRLSEGEQTFAEAARQYSHGIESYTGGMMSPTSIGRLPQSLTQVIRFLNPGELYRPIAFNNCFMIIRLEQIIPAKLNSVTAQSLLDEMFESWLQKQLKTLETQKNFI